MRKVLFASALALTLGCQAADQPAGAQAQSAETRDANTSYKPAFPNQTRAPLPKERVEVDVAEIATGLEHPWALEPLPDGRWVVTEKPGRLRVVTADGKVLEPIAGVPAVDARRQGGLLDVAIKPIAGGAFQLCLSYAEPRGADRNATAVSCGVAQGAPNLTLSDMKVVFRQEPPWASVQHYGSRVIFAPDGTLLITTGDRSRRDARGLSQDINATLGKVVRIKPDGSPAADNPFVAQGGPAAQVWSYGHRNIQGAALRADGQLWTIEHGPRGGDELNRPEKGKNYGWPIITYGIEYSGGKIGEGLTAMAGMEQPVYYWDPVIAPGGMTFYSGAVFPQWRGDALIGGLGSLGLVRLQLEGDRVVSEERIDLDARIRDVAQGNDGAVYVVTDEPEGRILKLTPKAAAKTGGTGG